MRIRKRKWIDDEIESSSFYIEANELKNAILNKVEKFGFKNIEMEIGVGKGTFIAQLASSNPDTLYIGADIAGTMLGMANKNIREMYESKNISLDNIILVNLNAEYILEAFLGLDIKKDVYNDEKNESIYAELLEDKDSKVWDEEIYEKGGKTFKKGLDDKRKKVFEKEVDEKIKLDRIYINFPNPWPKKRHKKRRLTHPRQLKQYLKILKNKSEIFFKTDDLEFFEESLIYILNLNKFSYKYQKEFEKFNEKYKEEFLEKIKKQIEKINKLETEEYNGQIILPELYIRDITFDLEKEKIFENYLGKDGFNIETEHEKEFKSIGKNICAAIINRRK